MIVTENKYSDGERDLVEICLTNETGMKISLSTLGAGIRDIYVPDRCGVTRLVTARPMDETLMARAAHGKTIGRTSGRIANAEFEIDGRKAVLDRNNRAVDNLHGGSESFRYKVFDREITHKSDSVEVAFTYRSRDGEGGYFGNVTLVVTYVIFARENGFVIRYDGTTDVKTLMNITNHAYFNLSGDLRETVENHVLYLASPKVGYVNDRGVTVKTCDVSAAFDFRNAHEIGRYLNSPEVQRVTGGYDHPFFVDGSAPAASVYCPSSGIALDVVTDYPCVVVYTNNAIKGYKLVGDVDDRKHLSVCLECQYHPDGVHLEPEHCGIFTPDKPYRNEVKYTFTISNKTER